VTAQSTDDVHTVFLASRSNYQNLIEGTHVPGVSYPTELSTNLTSKRTSHKIAEQGRRNRINLALQEMLHLLPKSSSRSPVEISSPKQDDDSGKKSESGGKGGGNSKAATVESAIEYIKALKRETEEMSKAAEAKDKECEELRQKLKDMKKLFGEKGDSLVVEEEEDESEDEEPQQQQKKSKP
jgi:Helix-loop-helix DNA-binding domain